MSNGLSRLPSKSTMVKIVTGNECFTEDIFVTTLFSIT
jgi:hypothetical protein